MLAGMRVLALGVVGVSSCPSAWSDSPRTGSTSPGTLLHPPRALLGLIAALQCGLPGIGLPFQLLEMHRRPLPALPPRDPP